jgi:hypothetical protein
MISGSRAVKGDQSRIVISGTAIGLVGAAVTPRVRLAGQTSFSSGRPFTPAESGRFRWSRKTMKAAVVFMQAGDVRSNRVIIRSASKR